MAIRLLTVQSPKQVQSGSEGFQISQVNFRHGPSLNLPLECVEYVCVAHPLTTPERAPFYNCMRLTKSKCSDLSAIFTTFINSSLIIEVSVTWNCFLPLGKSFTAKPNKNP